MAFTCNFDPGHNLVIIRHSTFSSGEGPVSLKAIIDHPDHKKGMNILRDFSLIQIPEDQDTISTMFLNRTAISAFESALGPCKIAVVINTDRWVSFIDRLLKMTPSTTIVRHAFASHDEALEWLGAPESALDHPEGTAAG